MVQDERLPAENSNKVLHLISQVLSYVFHPLFIPTFAFIWTYERFPFEFSGITPNALFFRLIGVFWTTAFFPAFAVFLLWRLKFIASIHLKTQKERIIPYVISMFFYWWSAGPPNVASMDNSFWWTGVAIRLAQQIGMHREPSPRDKDAGLKRRIWWTLYVSHPIACFNLVDRTLMGSSQ